MSAETAIQANEPHMGGLNQRLNWLRAGVLGANDGIVSVAAVVVGVAGATSEISAIFTAGAAALVGGAVSMALGEYISVSSQKDSEDALIAKEKRELAEDPEGELAELAHLYQERGLSPETAMVVAQELTAHDALAAHLEVELQIDEADTTNPWQAAWASFLAFTVGAILPFITILLVPAPVKVALTFIVTLLALAFTGALGAHLGGSSKTRAGIRVVIGGALALGVTFLVGMLFGHTIA